MSATINFKNSS